VALSEYTDNMAGEEELLDAGEHTGRVGALIERLEDEDRPRGS
jgi:hypothetical protein